MNSSQRPLVLVKCCNGLQFDTFYRDVLICNMVTQEFEVRKPAAGERPDVIVFGPYGSDVPAPGDYLRVGYICENYAYDGPPCDFVFTVSEQNLRDTPSARIQWHGIDPEALVKSETIDPENTLRSKTRFCNFLYSNPVPYREEFFQRLSKYKRIDAPGASMRNMPSIDEGAPPGQSRWETKRRFLAKYKFTLALENEIFPGYQTEKLYDGMRANSIPVYFGDSQASKLFNPGSFVSAPSGESGHWLSKLRDFGQFRWVEAHGPERWRYENRLRRRLRVVARDLRHRYLLSKYIQAVIDEMVELDRDDEKYVAKLRQPWLRQNKVDANSYSLASWTSIFSQVPSQRTRASSRQSGRVKHA